MLITSLLSCEFLEMQSRLNDVLGLPVHHTNPRVSIDSITSFAGSINTKKAYKKFCKNLYRIGVTSEMISQKEGEILNIFNSQDTAISGQIENSNIADQSQFPVVSHFFCCSYLIYILLIGVDYTNIK